MKLEYPDPPLTDDRVLLRKCGFTEEGRLRSHLRFAEDDVSDALVFSLLEADLV